MPSVSPPNELAGASPTRTAAWTLALYTCTTMASESLQSRPGISLLVQLGLLSWAQPRLPVALTDPEWPKERVVRLLAQGVAFGLALACLPLVVLAVTSSVVITPAASVEPWVLVSGLIAAAAHAWIDEQLLRAWVLSSLTPLGTVAKVLACGLVAAGAAIGRGENHPAAMGTAGLLGVVFAALWCGFRAQGALTVWVAWGAHAAMRWAADTVLRGGIVDVRLPSHAWAQTSGALLSGVAAEIALAPVCVGAIVLLAVRTWPKSGEVR
jgi:hypothetical protein